VWDLLRVDDGLLVFAAGPRGIPAAAARIIFFPVGDLP
jgi:hypothetical protein